MANTRVQLLLDLNSWSRNPSTHRVFWLDGMAGTGKSAIARSLCHSLRDAGLLGASFFCARGIRDDVKRIIPTLAMTLARHNGLYKLALLDILQATPDAAHARLEVQVECLLKKPLFEAFGGKPPALVLVIDALDECADDKATEVILSELITQSPDIPVKFFVTSRPEPYIRAQFNMRPNLYDVVRLHDIEQDIVEADISLYLSRRLHNIRDSRERSDPSYEFPVEWPGHTDIETVTRLAGKLFIYAFTVAEYVRNDPVERLEKLTAFLVSAGKPLTKALDDMYFFILSKAMNPNERDADEIFMTKRILAIILTVREHLRVSTLSELVGIPVRRIRGMLDPLHAVVYMPSRDDTGAVSTFHASFGDYLTARERAQDFFIDTPSGQYDLAQACIKVMSSDLLHFNVTGCATSYLPNAQQTLAVLPVQLIYSCLHWPHHVTTASGLSKLLLRLEKVLREKFLFWLEVLSAVGKAHLASQLLMRVMTANNRRTASLNLTKFVRDANNFVIIGKDAIELSVPHIYLSVLPSVHRTSTVAVAFWPRFLNRPVLEASGVSTTPRTLLHMQGHTKAIKSVAVSSDGRRIVSGSDDTTIRVWDVATGDALLKSMEGHTDSISSVAISADCTMIISGSYDGTIRMWNAMTGQPMLTPMRGHTDLVTCVVFSTDGTRILSSSNDRTIRVWDVFDGEPLTEPWEGHTKPVNSISCSPDGIRVASGSSDGTIRLWNPDTGESLLDPLRGHIGSVWSVSFSPDGTRVASGSHDRTVCVWDAFTGESLLKLPDAHLDWIGTVAFSSDGLRIVSGSSDRTVKVWNATTGKLAANTLEGHSNIVESVAFSSDGTCVVSGSADGTIRVWDATSDEPIKFLDGHADWINCVAYSPDGSRIVSCSHDKTLRLWDAATGEPIMKPLRGHTAAIWSVAFSHAGDRIVSGSSDRTIRIWDATTGELQLGPLEGHDDWVKSVAFSPDDTRVVSGAQDKTIIIWDALTGMAVMEPIEGHTGSVTSVAFCPDGTCVVSGSHDKTIRLWDARTGKPILKPFEGHVNWVVSTIFSPDGTHIVSASHDKTIRIWNATTGELVTKPLEGHSDWVNAIAYSSDGRRLVSVSKDGTIRVWNTLTGAPLTNPIKGHTHWILAVAFSLDGKCVVTGSTDAMIRVWDITTSQKTATSPLIAFSPCRGISSLQSSALCITEHSCSIHSLDEGHDINDYRDILSFDPVSGWITSPQGKLILWVPREYRIGLWCPRNTLVIGQSRTIYDLSRFVHGIEWTQSYASGLGKYVAP
ncbi:hypothetical protein CERSUDRAFT_161328 [Gelatoporia subvermispora B]|uniref:NACHT domain-containing protein n=1 Tax=Ceriporiopsis subvermispora (strain B) TaxID=914234 RepID=M2PB73_CERS8|nr:hypothetical protein CERSUDRAFT_161328 [Gelatoporia subvermispora B]